MGKYPWYFPYFLHSCRYNPTVDFLIFTDNYDPNLEIPSNVKMIPYSIDLFKADAAKTLGFEVAVSSGYKLCDFKPAYGTIFSDCIKDYDFWGYCDMDMIFGNVSVASAKIILCWDAGSTPFHLFMEALPVMNTGGTWPDSRNGADPASQQGNCFKPCYLVVLSHLIRG